MQHEGMIANTDTQMRTGDGENHLACEAAKLCLVHHTQSSIAFATLGESPGGQIYLNHHPYLCKAQFLEICAFSIHIYSHALSGKH